MIRIPRAAVMILLAVVPVLVTGCSSTEGGTAVTGSGSSSRAGATSGVGPLPVASAPASSSADLAGTPVPPPASSLPVSTPAPTRVTLPATTASPSPRPTLPTKIAPRTTTAPSSTRPAPSTVTSTTSTPARTTPATTARTPTAAAFPVCPTIPATDIAGIVGCLKTSVSDFWSGELNEVVDQDVIVDPTTAQVPADCRGGLTAAPAFTCQINDTVYINQSFLDEVTHDFGANDIPYALASVVSHEIGHVVQAAVEQPGYDRTGSSNSISQQIEQQADCLSGVWALSQVKLGRLDTKVFETVAKQLITDVSTNPEIYTHGTPDQRAAAILQGLSTGTPQGCKLNTFS